MTLSRRSTAWLWGIIGASMVIALGGYAGAISGGERGGFVMNFPAEGLEVGGPSPRALTGSIEIPLESAGFIKRTLQPGVVEVASHVVSNVGDTPRRIRFEAAGFKDSIEWHSRDRAWNPETGEIEREIEPGESVDFGFLVHLPDPLPAVNVPVKGTVRIYDATTGEKLSELPVRFTREGFVRGSCCEWTCHSTHEEPPQARRRVLRRYRALLRAIRPTREGRGSALPRIARRNRDH